MKKYQFQPKSGRLVLKGLMEVETTNLFKSSINNLTQKLTLVESKETFKKRIMCISGKNCNMQENRRVETRWTCIENLLHML